MLGATVVVGAAVVGATVVVDANVVVVVDVVDTAADASGADTVVDVAGVVVVELEVVGPEFADSVVVELVEFDPAPVEFNVVVDTESRPCWASDDVDVVASVGEPTDGGVFISLFRRAPGTMEVSTAVDGLDGLDVVVRSC